MITITYKDNDDKRNFIDNLMQDEGFKFVGHKTTSGGFEVRTYEPTSREFSEDTMLSDADHAVRDIPDASCYTVNYPRHGLCVSVMFEPVKGGTTK